MIKLCGLLVVVIMFFIWFILRVRRIVFRNRFRKTFEINLNETRIAVEKVVAMKIKGLKETLTSAEKEREKSYSDISLSVSSWGAINTNEIYKTRKRDYLNALQKLNDAERLVKKTLGPESLKTILQIITQEERLKDKGPLAEKQLGPTNSYRIFPVPKKP